MKKKTTVAFVTQKGGCTKSTTTLITANILQYKFGKKVAIIDYDNQSTIYSIRRDDLEYAQKTPKLQEALKNQNIKEFEILQADLMKYSVEESLAAIDDDVDFVFFDYPAFSLPKDDKKQDVLAQVRNKLLRDYSELDVILVPLTDSMTDNNSTFDFITELVVCETINPKLLNFFCTKIERQKRDHLAAVAGYKAWAELLGLDMFETFIPRLTIFGDGFSLSDKTTQKTTCIRNSIILPSEEDLKKSNYLDFVQEFLQKTEKI